MWCDVCGVCVVYDIMYDMWDGWCQPLTCCACSKTQEARNVDTRSAHQLERLVGQNRLPPHDVQRRVPARNCALRRLSHTSLALCSSTWGSAPQHLDSAEQGVQSPGAPDRAAGFRPWCCDGDSNSPSAMSFRCVP